EALADHIRRARVQRRADAAASDSSHPFGPLALQPFTHAPLVGRAAEHMALVAAYRLAQRGTPQAIVIKGEPGIGKTRLTQEFLAWASAQGAEVLQGRAFETGGHIPYHPVVEALREILGREPDPRRLLGATWLAELSRL